MRARAAFVLQWAALLALGLVTVSCSKTRTTRCGDLVCPVGKVCYASGPQCVHPEQITSCKGAADGQSCSFPGSVHGRCVSQLCVDPVCGDGIVEPGEACDDGNTKGGDGCSADCLSDETCGNGIVDAPREQCDDGNHIDGDGCQSDCLLPRCGDGVLDPGEACDDGNNVDGDGCNAVCTSNETCGNGWTDFSLGEQCDDGNFLSHDGCSSVCTAELPLWQKVNAFLPPASRFVRLVYDSRRDRLVAFGGSDPSGQGLPDTSELVHDKWETIRISGPAPPPRQDHVMVYDPSRGVTVVFGGHAPIHSPPPTQFGPPLGDTWEYDGHGWVETTSASSPSARSGAAAAYDAAGKDIVMFGGDDGSGVLGDTWVYNGTWTEIPVSGPPARSGASMAYDASRQVIVLFGGHDAAGNPLNDTWQWNGTAWSQVTTAVTIPDARGDLVYDAGLGRVVLFGGSQTGGPNNSTWTFDGTDWSKLAIAGPPARFGMGMAYDAATNLIHVYHGQDATGPGLSDEWVFDGTAWTEFSYRLGPQPRDYAAALYDSLRHETLLYGGQTQLDGGAAFGDLWLWNGQEWRELDTDNAPVPTAAPAGFVFDTARGCSILVLGAGTGYDTWELCGRVWRQLVTDHSPPNRDGPAVVYDAGRDRVVLFGGQNGSTLLSDTWEFDGADWSQVTTANAPSGRFRMMATYDPKHSRVVAFGGQTARGPSSETWTYDGMNWSRVMTADSPPPRFAAGLVYYRPRQSVIVTEGSPGPLTDTWEFDGTNWTQLTSPIVPEPRPAGAYVFDEAHDVLIATNGSPPGAPASTWKLTYSSTHPDEQCAKPGDEDGDGLQNCADPDCDGQQCGPGAKVCRGGACVCAGGAHEKLCGDGVDNDCDGLVDCADPDCFSSPTCTAESNCSDGIDNDHDGLTDCQDPGCIGVDGCQAVETNCSDGKDNDGNGLVDCQDPSCYLLGPCTKVTP